MLQDFLVALVLAVIAFELIEHVLVPIVWLFLKGRKKSDYGIGGMQGKTVEILCWKDKSGIVLFHAERWQAVGENPMQPGEKAIVEAVSGLTLKVKPCMDAPEDKIRHL
jgi:membrane-bound ClpP family serine protease